MKTVIPKMFDYLKGGEKEEKGFLNSDHNVNSSANDRGAIFGIRHAGEPLN